MEPIVISDTSCLIDLRKLNLLGKFHKLEYRFTIPAPLFDDECKNFTDDEKKIIEQSCDISPLTSREMEKALELQEKNTGLSIYDCFVLSCALERKATLMTGDRKLRKLCSDFRIEKHGVLWLLDRLLDKNILSRAEYLEKLQFIQNTPAIRVPPSEISKRLNFLQKN